MASNPVNSESDFHQEAFNIAIRRNYNGSEVNEFPRNSDNTSISSNQNINSPRKIYPEKLIDDVNTRYVR